MLEVVKPTAQRRIQIGDNSRQTIPRVRLLLIRIRSRMALRLFRLTSAAPLEAIAQKLKALPFLPTSPTWVFSSLRLRPLASTRPSLGQRRLCLLSTAAQHHKVVGVAHHPVACCFI